MFSTSSDNVIPFPLQYFIEARFSSAILKLVDELNQNSKNYSVEKKILNFK